MDTASRESADMMRVTYRGAKVRDNESSMVTMKIEASSQKHVLPLWLQSRTLWDSVGQVATSGNLGRVSSREVQAYLLPPWARAPTLGQGPPHNWAVGMMREVLRLDGRLLILEIQTLNPHTFRQTADGGENRITICGTPEKIRREVTCPKLETNYIICYHINR